MIENYLPKKKNKKRFPKKPFLWLAVFFILLAGAGYLVIFSQLFKIEKIIIAGNNTVEAEKIEKIYNQIAQQKILNKIGKNNYFLLPEKEISAAILINFPEIKKAALEKNLRESSLVINIEEREPTAIWCRVFLIQAQADLSSATSSESVIVNASSTPVSAQPEIDKCFFVDQSGFLFRKAPILSGGALATVLDETNSEIDIGKTVTDSKMLEFILEAKKELASGNIDLSDFIVKSQSLGDLEILSSDGWRIYLDINKSAASQISALKRLLEEELKEKKSQLDYVDLRVPNRIYYKLK